VSDDKIPPEDLETTKSAGLTESAPPLRIGPYRLLQKIGEGGMGEVWLAEQAEPIRRRIGLKLIKAGMDTKQVVARFESERQALALMDHPAIAKVFDAGTTPEGRPYFAMEYVKGEPITRYCDRHRLATRERLELFTKVCEGVQHAHQKGIIHRDVKASNVLVTIRAEKPVPKIIDFGVAKATEQRLTEQTVYTQLGVLIGTPEYMSPEQAEMTGLDVDTRTDVYSLGVLLYELLTGVLPFDPAELRKSGFDAIRRKIRQEEPSRPSTRVSTLSGEQATSLSASHRVELPTLKRQLKGDLDWITMKALEKDRTRRYQSATELAADIERHLTDEPVLASPPSAAYRMGKFVRRHRLGVGAGSVVLLALVAGISGTTVGLVRATRAEAEAKREAAAAEQVSEFLVDLFEVSDPNEARGNTITAREILDKGAERIDNELRDQPLVQARLMGTMGKVYQRLGLRGQARPLLEEALVTRQRLLGDDHLEVAESLHGLADLVWMDGIEQARPLYERALEIREETLGPDHPEVARTLGEMAWMTQASGDLETARSLYERALDIQERTLGPDHADVATTLGGLALLADWAGDEDEARPLYERAVAIRERALGLDDPGLVNLLRNYALVMTHRPDAMRALCERALTIAEQVYGPDHPSTGGSAMILANALLMTGEHEEALRLMERDTAIQEKAYGPDHPQVAAALVMVGYVRHGLGRYEDALSALQRARVIFEEAYGPNPRVLSGLADVLRDTGDYEAARSLYERALAIWEKQENLDEEWAPRGIWGLAKLYVLQEQPAKARPLLDRGLAMARERWGQGGAEFAYARASYHALVGEPDEALRLLRRAVDLGASAVIAIDPNFTSLHGDPEYEAIVAEVKERYRRDRAPAKE
jgi:serine/threonine protein kinase/tetratricopeptide (TPR) repeat protein